MALPEDIQPVAPRGGLDVDHDLIAQADPYQDRFEDADLYNRIESSQRNIPWWLAVMVGMVMLLAVMLNAPFLTGGGGNPLERLAAGAGGGSFLDGGMLAALLYVGGGFVVIFWYTWRRRGGKEGEAG
ncbi:MAG: hypothetical protein OEY97_01045 [Nitrospirota bacterium]|nr:hypothetical protein [Nitrospirota bacterium]